MQTVRPALFLALIGAVLFGTACSSMPWMSSTDGSGEVAGTYQVRQFEFVPQASALEEIDVLEHIDKNDTKLQLTESKDFVLKYRTKSGDQTTLTGTYSVAPEKVVFDGQQEDTKLYRQVLLDHDFYLLRKGARVLWVDTKKSVSLEEISSSYAGLTGVRGVLRVEFVHEKNQAISRR